MTTPATKRAAVRQRVADHRARRRRGLACYSPPITESVIDMLVRRRYLDDWETPDKQKVALAIAQFMLDAADLERNCNSFHCPDCGRPIMGA